MYEIYVQPRFSGGWEAIEGDSFRTAAVAKTRSQAVERARRLLDRLGGGQIIIVDEDGREQRANDRGRHSRRQREDVEALLSF